MEVDSMSLTDTAGSLITLGVAYNISKDIMKPRKKKCKRRK